MELGKTDYRRMVALLESMSDIIYKYQRYTKPSEADKARQARQVLKKLKKKGLI